jgi:hypothetical protein
MSNRPKRSKRDSNADLSSLREIARQREVDESLGFESATVQAPKEDKLFGMNAVERMFLSIGLFGVTLVVSILLLIVTESIAL